MHGKFNAGHGVEMAHEGTGRVTRGYNVKSDDMSSDMKTDYKPAPFSFRL